LPRVEGHRRGVASVRRTVRECSRLGLEQLTLYCLSSENWKRPETELNLLLNLLGQFVVEERGELLRQNLRFTMIGHRDGIPPDVLADIDTTIDMTSEHTGMTLCLAVDYGSRREILDGVKRFLTDRDRGVVTDAELTEDRFADYLDTAGMPDPDLLLRTANERRISNFLLWQISYAEIWVTDKFWPQFDAPDLHEALRDYAARDRRYGGLVESPE